MVNSLKIKARLVELGKTQDSVAREMNMAQATFSLKINNKRAFTVSEAKQLIEVLEIADTDICSFLFV